MISNGGLLLIATGIRLLNVSLAGGKLGIITAKLATLLTDAEHSDLILFVAHFNHLHVVCSCGDFRSRGARSRASAPHTLDSILAVFSH